MLHVMPPQTACCCGLSTTLVCLSTTLVCKPERNHCALIIFSRWLQVRVNAPMLELPRSALSVTAGEVLSVAPPYVQGAFMVFPVSRRSCLPTSSL